MSSAAYHRTTDGVYILPAGYIGRAIWRSTNPPSGVLSLRGPGGETSIRMPLREGRVPSMLAQRVICIKRLSKRIEV